MVVVLAAPGVAVAQGPATNPFAPLPVPNTPAPTTATPPLVNPNTTTTAGGGGLSGASAAAIAIGAIVLLAAISFFIWRDARRRAPVRHAHATTGVGGNPGSKRPPKPRKLSQAERRRRKRGRAR